MAAEQRKTIAVVGTGVIGRSWTTLFLAKGHKVIVSDPAPGAKEKLDQFIQNEWPRMQKAGVVDGADPRAYGFVEDISDHLEGVDFVQENAPERPEFKTKLIGKLDSLLPKGTIIASSSSGIPSSQFIGECKNDRSRVLIGHPFNPPHLIPLVEVVPHPDTSSDAVERAIDFYKSLGKAPVLVKKETPGFLANRLQAAVLSEAYSLVSRGIASAEDVDTAMSTGPGLRWALAGPYMTNVLGGGSSEVPFKHFIEHLGPAVAGWKRDMDEHSFSWNDEDVEKLTKEVKPFVDKSDTEGVRRYMGDGLIELLELKKDKANLIQDRF
ncbi:Putative 3-hydroxyacyl-CoA dehydrogenase, 6-phosphogluconate dehydrogenase-like domain superfamily [Septoria linicola]|uniref:3-hydroxyacyl-CoA dehydrogenase, 6-phosphogluconate dehydrogenase-like domain superfamily n=1 Tax=Septoria linicola TaxID=215465 RepID=A0A9Q9AZ80_9PEZI|nr:Putative 3-hydroxyacyl-CoA dehydrogenase, 6-phosphogluconate dehydrogenase-like domain superfamily [Septoria linicola]